MKTQSVYIEVPVSERLPDEDGKYLVKTKFSEHTHSRNFTKSMSAFEIYDGYKVTHWYEKKEGYFFTKEEFEKAIGDAFDAGSKLKYNEFYGDLVYPDKKQYLANLK